MGSLGCDDNSATSLNMMNNGHHYHQQEKVIKQKSNDEKKKNMTSTCGFEMPLHYPRYKKEDYEKMPEWKLDCLLKEYGLPTDIGDVEQKRNFAMGTFLWT